MKIGLSTSSIEHSLNHGIMDGIGHYTAQINKNLISNNHTVCPYAFPRLLKTCDFSTSQALPRSYIAQLAGASFGLLKPVTIDAEVFHSTDYKIVPMSCPVVATIWDAIALVHPEWLRKGIRRHLAPLLFKQSAGYADRVICVSEHAGKELMQYFKIPEKKLRLVPWAIANHWLTQHGETNIQAVHKKYHLCGEYILTVGTIQPRKNFSRLIDAFLTIPENNRQNIKLLIVGKIGWGSEEVLQKINANQDAITHLDNVNDDTDLQCIYQGARLFVFPSLYEGFGMPVLEAFASNVPVIASRTTSVPEVSGDAAMLVDPRSSSELGSAISTVLSNSALANNMIARGKERLTLFSEEKMIQETLKVYQEVI